jgi:hypothetical protein
MFEYINLDDLVYSGGGVIVGIIWTLFYAAATGQEVRWAGRKNRGRPPKTVR